MSGYTEFIDSLPTFDFPQQLETGRLLLRQWRDEDYKPFAALNADPVVMAHFPAVLDRQASDEMAGKIRQLINRRGWGFWALKLKNTGEFIGFTGLHTPDKALPFSPCVEVGWRLVRSHWGQGFATEAAIAAEQFAFNVLKLNALYAFTPLSNTRSQAVMQRLGMVDTGRNFDHPDIADGHPLKEHRLYRKLA